MASSPTEVRLRVTGMHCAGCAASVQRVLEATPGVAGATVSLTGGVATITPSSGFSAEDARLAIEGKGFAAEPLDESLPPAVRLSDIEHEQRENARRWARRAAIGLSLWVVMAALHWIFRPAPPWLPWVLFAGATLILVLVGAGFYASAYRAARRGTTNMDTLIAMGATTAYLFSVAVFLRQLAGAVSEQPLYFTEAAALLGLISLGHWLEARASARAGSAVRDLLELQPDTARLVEPGGRTRDVPSADVRPGDRLAILPGDRVPVDGVVVDGETELDESVVTGEPLPALRERGDPVVAGSMNTIGRVIIEATVDGRRTTIARIADLVERAQASKANIQRLADRVCAIFVPAVLMIAGLTLGGWWAVGEPTRGIIAAVTVLIISCPCALGLATPMAVMVGSGVASRRGILFKSAAAIERAARAERVVFDKTGTLTEGAPAVTAIDVAAGGDERTLLRLTASVEAASEHPIGRAIVRAAAERGVELAPVAAFAATPGFGVRGAVDGHAVTIEPDEQATCRIMVDGVLAGTISVTDRPRDGARGAIDALRGMGLELAMLSGDRPERARIIGEDVGLRESEIHASATPERKLEVVRDLGPGTVMVGDGINDAAALAVADLGIAMASGTNIAIEAADVVIPGTDVGAVVSAIHLARRTLRTIRQNLFFAFFYNALMIPLAAFGLLGLHGPVVAAIAMAVSDVTVIGNAARLRRESKP